MKAEDFQPRTRTWNSRAAIVFLAVSGVGLAAYHEARPPSGEILLPSKPSAMSPADSDFSASLPLTCELASLPSSSDGTPSVSSEPQASVEEALRQAESAFEYGKLDEAMSKVGRAIELDPNSAHAYYLLGVIQSERGAAAEAKEALLKSLELDPSRMATHALLARIYLQAKELPAAAREFQAVVKLGDSTGLGHYGQALVYLDQSRYSEALPHLVAAVAANPREPERLLSLVATELELKQVERAESYLIQIEKLSLCDPWLSYRLGRVLEQHGMSKKAQAEFERATANLGQAKGNPPPDVNLADFYLRIAQVRFNQNDYSRVLESLGKIPLGTVEPRLEAAILHLEGSALLGVGQVMEAREKLRQAANLDPSLPDYLTRLAWAELLAGDAQAAKAAAETARSKWPEEPKVEHIAALVERESIPEGARVPFSQDWHLEGEGLVCCPCAVPCPCRSNGLPTHGHCENAGGFRVREGHYGNIRLDGLVFATFNGSMELQAVPNALYVVRSATDEQIIAFERLVQTFNPLLPVVFLNVKRADISFTDAQAEKTYEVRVPGVLRLKIRRQLDSQGKPISQTAALDQFSNTIEYAQNLIYKAWDEGGVLKWDYSGRQANYRVIDLDSRAYKDRTMLVQFTDNSGFFNQKQLELIKSLKLPTLRSYPKTEPARNLPER